MEASVSDVAGLAHFAGLLLAKLQQSRVYDVLMRLPMLVYGTLIGGTSVMSLAKYIDTVDPTLPNAVYGVNIAMRVSNIVFFFLLATMAVMRGRVKGKARGAEPR